MSKGTVWLLEDVTERIRTENELLEKEKELEDAQLLAKSGSWSYDPVTQKSVWSKGMFHIWGLDPTMGRFPMEDHQKYIHPDDYSLFESIVKEAVENGTPYNAILRLITPAGVEKTINTICEPVCDSLGSQTIRTSGANLTSLINDILDLSKIEAGKVTIEMTEFSLQHCISDIMLMQQSVIYGKGLKLDIHIADTIPAVLRGNPLRIKQILLNLLGNAVKFTSQGTILTHEPCTVVNTGDQGRIRIFILGLTYSRP
ncbi:MAG: PAS domain-containing protein, partial [Desulfuromonadales bacterium]